MNSRLGLSVDIGGTFTDIVLERGDQRRTKKVLTTPARPEEAVLTGIHEILVDASLALADVDIFVHGTTLATNTLKRMPGADPSERIDVEADDDEVLDEVESLLEK